MIIGLTGGFGTGKTFTASIFKARGARVIDADLLAHDMIRKGEPSYFLLVKKFGEKILQKDGEIDRRKLGKIVFKDKRNVAMLNAIVHPSAIQCIRREIDQMAPGEIAVLDAPLLVEVGLHRAVDRVIVVTCSRKNQIARCMKRFGLNRQEVLARIRTQLPIARKVALADYVIDNDGEKSKTEEQVKSIWEELWK